MFKVMCSLNQNNEEYEEVELFSPSIIKKNWPYPLEVEVVWYIETIFNIQKSKKNFIWRHPLSML